MSELLSACEESFVMGDMDLIWSCRTRNLIQFFLHYRSPLGWKKVSSGKERRRNTVWSDMLNWRFLGCCHQALTLFFPELVSGLEVNVKRDLWRARTTSLLAESILCFLGSECTDMTVPAWPVYLSAVCLSLSLAFSVGVLAFRSLIYFKGNRLRLTSSVIIWRY